MRVGKVRHKMSVNLTFPVGWNDEAKFVIRRESGPLEASVYAKYPGSFQLQIFVNWTSVIVHDAMFGETDGWLLGESCGPRN